MAVKWWHSFRGFKEGRERKRAKTLKSVSYEMASLSKLREVGDMTQRVLTDANLKEKEDLR